MFPDEAAARRWFEAKVWPAGRYCPKCGSTDTHHASHKFMPYWCPACRSYFSVKTGTALESSKVSLRKWAFAIYMHLTSLKGRVEHEVASRHRRVAEDGMVHAPAHPQGVER